MYAKKYNKIEKALQLAEKIKGGANVALVTDAGTPGISDPGEELVKICCEQGIEVTSLPGAAACVTADPFRTAYQTILF